MRCIRIWILNESRKLCFCRWFPVFHQKLSTVFKHVISWIILQFFFEIIRCNSLCVISAFPLCCLDLYCVFIYIFKDYYCISMRSMRNISIILRTWFILYRSDFTVIYSKTSRLQCCNWIKQFSFSKDPFFVLLWKQGKWLK